MKNIRLHNLYIWINILKRLYSFILLGIWLTFIFKGYSLYITKKDLILSILKFEFTENRELIDSMMPLAIEIGIILGSFILSLIIYSFIKQVFRSLPLPSSFIGSWNNTNQITPMLAHRLIHHYSFNTSITIYQFFNIYNYSEIEAKILSYNFKNKNLEGLFKRFEPNLVNEINIYNTYFPKLTLLQKFKSFFTGKDYRTKTQEKAAENIYQVLQNTNDNVFTSDNKENENLENIKEHVSSNNLENDNNYQEPTLDDNKLTNQEENNKL